jgi:hypothetical protein
MLLGKKSALKNHLSVKKQTWAHKVIAHGPHEQNMETERYEESRPDRDPLPTAERSEFTPIRY